MLSLRTNSCRSNRRNPIQTRSSDEILFKLKAITVLPENQTVVNIHTNQSKHEAKFSLRTEQRSIIAQIDPNTKQSSPLRTEQSNNRTNRSKHEAQFSLRTEQSNGFNKRTPTLLRTKDRKTIDAKTVLKL